MFEISVEQSFAAGHSLRGYRGKCENVHGHNYRVRVIVEGEQLDAAGLLVDFVEIKRLMNQLIERWDHRFLNDIPPFDTLNPTAENMARWFCEQMQKKLDAAGHAGVRVQQVRIWETDIAAATYRPG